MSQVFNIMEMEVNGKALNLGTGSTFKFGGIEREDVQGDSGTDYKEMPVPAEASVKLKMTSEVSLQEILNWRSVNVNIRLDTGQTYSMANAWAMAPEPIASGDGIVSFTLKSNRANETLAGGNFISNALN